MHLMMEQEAKLNADKHLQPALREEESPDTLMGEEEELPEPWILFTDGSSCTYGSGAGLILTNPEGIEFTYPLRFSAGGGTKRKVDKYGGSLAVVEEEGDTWMSLIFKYLMDGTLPIRSEITRAVKRKSWRRKKADKGMPRLPNSQACPKESSAKAKPNQRLRVQSKSGFTKLMKQATVATITGKQIKKFIWDNIVCRFGLPGEIISNNEKQFQDNLFKDWCEKLCIRQHFASVKHLQTNGLVERANRSLGEGIKARLDERSKNWMEELPHVLWAHRTMIKSSNGDTPFLLTYGTKVVIPAEIGMPTLRTAEVDLVQNNEALEINLDLLEERREQAAIREAKSKAKMERYYNSKVRSISFKPGDLVYRNNDASRAEDTGKLGPKWEGPYEVTEALGKGAYKLRDRDGKQLPRTWNISNLKKCYVHQM
ncbi:reverse transcriptase domain-containing protein [Tanacetum coccineum]